MTTWTAWRNDLPSSWVIVPLRAAADYAVSNVDKIPSEDELPVRLCNYTDVYNNEFITPAMDFMRCTATPDEIKKFGLRIGDVVITKDSESWDDIAIPALVVKSADDLVCGYHLALLRPHPEKLDSRFLLRCLQAKMIRVYLELAANGVTRFGIPKYDIGKLPLPLPSLREQKQIADYVEREAVRIDELVASKRKLLELLNEKLRAFIVRAVTRGLNQPVRMKASGHAWLGEIPAHWEIKRTKRVFSERDDRSETGDEEMLTVSHITGVTKRSEKDVNMFEAESNEGYKKCSPGNLAINTLWAWMGAMGISPEEGIVSPAYHVYELSDEILPGYVDALVRTPAFVKEVTRFSTGVWSSRLRLYPEGLFEVRIPVPPMDEQKAIVAAIEKERARTSKFETELRRSITLLKERRTALITAAVTGEIPVSEMTK